MGTRRGDTKKLARLLKSIEDLCPCRGFGPTRGEQGTSLCSNAVSNNIGCQCMVDRPISIICTWPVHMQARSMIRAAITWGAVLVRRNVPVSHLNRLERLLNEKGGHRYGQS